MCIARTATGTAVVATILGGGSEAAHIGRPALVRARPRLSGALSGDHRGLRHPSHRMRDLTCAWATIIVCRPHGRRSTSSTARVRSLSLSSSREHCSNELRRVARTLSDDRNIARTLRSTTEKLRPRPDDASEVARSDSKQGETRGARLERRSARSLARERRRAFLSRTRPSRVGRLA